MAIKIKSSPKLSQKTFKDLSRSLELDLEAAFTVWEDSALQLLKQAEEEDWDLDKLATALEMIE